MICRRAKRLISRSNGSRGSRLLFLCAVAFASFAGASEPETSSSKTEPLDPALKTELHGYTQLAKDAADKEKWPLADHFLELLVALPIPEAAKKSALGEIATSFEKKHERAKAIAIYEKMALLFAEDPDSPEMLFKAGELYREAGAYGRAIARFYSVLNATLKVKDSEIDVYRALTQRAQIEIAETHFLARDYQQAAKFCDLALRLDLPPEQRARIQFRLIHCKFVLGDSNGTIADAGKFLTASPEDPNAPECRYLLASALRSVDRKKEALETVLALLRTENTRKEKAPDRWAYWQKKTGNEFANDYYQRADFLSALTIYQTLAKLNEDPEWQWPVIYQMGLCFERLRLVSRAAEAYKYLIEQSEKPERTGQPLPESATNLVQMARWRGEQLAWQHTTETHLQHLLGEPQDFLQQAPVEPLNPAAANTP
jgi:tetratricopeptide (TPR) repeat protein